MSPESVLTMGPVTLAGGTVPGNGMRFASFQGIRYALEPSYSLRFQRPVPLDPEANATYDVSQESKVMCPQLEAGTDQVIGQEDCLMLNIYVPEKVYNYGDASKAAVMVWIHGKDLVTGSYSYDMYGPNEFMKRNVILVAINYRLGPLGFISTYDPQVGGNNGFRDQVLALKWVNRNIGSFGGNSSSVTVFGESAGGQATALHVLSPLSKGLFQRAIIQSGPPISFGIGVQDGATAQGLFYDLAGRLHCHELPLRCMEFKSVESIVYHSKLYSNPPYELPLTWMPVIEDFSPEPFLPKHPMDILKSGDFNTEVEVIIGTNSADGLFMVRDALNDSSLWPDYANSWDIAGTRALFGLVDNRLNDDDVDKADQALQFYVGAANDVNEDNSQDMINMFTDSIFLWGTQKTISFMLEHGMVVFQYVLSYEGSLSSGFGVDHNEDWIYLFNPPFASLANTDLVVRKMVTNAWTNFAINGNPNSVSSGLPEWEKCSSGQYPIKYYNISGPAPAMEARPEIGSRLKVWESFL